MKKILIVEDDTYYYNEWRLELEGMVVLIFASSIKEAEQQFTTNPDLSVIVMDACVPGDRPTTPPLVQKFRETFSGPMIAISGSEQYRNQLMQAGCDHKSTKEEMSAKVKEVLHL